MNDAIVDTRPISVLVTLRSLIISDNRVGAMKNSEWLSECAAPRRARWLFRLCCCSVKFHPLLSGRRRKHVGRFGGSHNKGLALRKLSSLRQEKRKMGSAGQCLTVATRSRRLPSVRLCRLIRAISCRFPRSLHTRTSSASSQRRCTGL